MAGGKKRAESRELYENADNAKKEGDKTQKSRRFAALTLVKREANDNWPAHNVVLSATRGDWVEKCVK